MTHDEANEILNAFAGWKAGQKCTTLGDSTCRKLISYGDERAWQWDDRDATHYHIAEHDISPTDYFADTPEAREAVRLLKDEFVRRKVYEIEVNTRALVDDMLYQVMVRGRRYIPYAESDIESHAIALAIAAALKEKI